MIEDIAVWSIYPDWADGVTETLEFLTSIGSSPFAVEQRRGLRLTPRQFIEYSYVLAGPTRTHFDLLTMRAGGSPAYVPMWHDSELLRFKHLEGWGALAVSTSYTEFMNTDFALIGGEFEYQVVEVYGRTDTVLQILNPLDRDWPVGTRVVPLKKCKIDTQASTTRRTDGVAVARVKFVSLVPNRTDAAPPLNMFGQQYVLEEDPNEADDLTYNYERVMATLDNTMGLQHMSDVTGQVLQQFAWWAPERVRQHRLRGLFYSLDGRRVPLWVPTLYADFEPVAPIVEGSSTIDVKRCGFTDLGGPIKNREYILIHARNGQRYYAKILESAILGDGAAERLLTDTPSPVTLTPAQIRRISFLVLSRLDQDTVEFIHHTNTRGITTAVAVFRSATGYPGIDLEGTIEIPAQTGDVCLNQFQWHNPPRLSLYPVVSDGRTPDRLDKYGNLYIDDGDTFRVFNQNGALVNTVTYEGLAALIDAWHGDTIVTSDFLNDQIMVCPIKQGEYVLVLGETLHIASFHYWFALMEPAADGSLTLKAAYYTSSLWGPPYVDVTWHVFDVKDNDSAILFSAETSFGGSQCVIGVLPPIKDFLNETYKDVGYAGLPACRIHNTIMYTKGLVDNFILYVSNGTETTIGYDSRNWGFVLPGNGRDVLYIYLNRSYLDYEAHRNLSTEVHDVIQPLFPLGVMLKVDLGNLHDYAGLADHVINSVYYGRQTPNYAYANTEWQDEDGGPAIPFLDEYTYLSDGSVGGTDCYQMQIAGQILRTNGHYWIIFYMVGADDAYARRTVNQTSYGSPVYARIRVFDYDPTTEVAVQIKEQTCKLHSSEDFPNDNITDLIDDKYLTATVVEEEGMITLSLTGPRVKTNFCQFAVPE